MTERELFNAWCDGDRAAGDQLFMTHFDGIYRFLSSKVADDVAEDLTQKAFVACIEARERFRGDASFRTFVFAVTKNLLMRHFRDRAGNKEIDFEVASVQDLAPGAATLLGDRAEQRLLLEALRHIPLDLQIVLELHFWEEMSGPELAEVLEIPEGTVRSRLRRAREALEQQIRRIAAAPDPLDSTLSDLDHWAASIKNLARSA